MIKTCDPLSPRIIDCLSTEYGIDVAAITLLPLGADRNASVYKAQTLEGLSYFVKLKRGLHHDVSVTLLEFLHDAGIQQIIAPVKTTQNRSIQHMDGYTLIVYPFVDGQDGFSQNLTKDQWVVLGKVLRQVHEVTVPSFIEQRIRRELYSSRWRESVRALYTQLETKLADDEITVLMARFLKNHQDVIHHLVNQAELLSQKMQELSPKFVLCHSDIHGGNVLIAENTSIYIVDWDAPIMAPKERDLMFIGGGVANVWNNPSEEGFFYKGYGETEVNWIIMAYYRYERIVEDIAEYGNELLLNIASTNDRSESYRHFTDIFVPGGVLDIALKTEERI